MNDDIDTRNAIVVILPVSRIPTNGIVRKMTGEKLYRIIDGLTIYSDDIAGRRKVEPDKDSRFIIPAL